MRTVVLGPRPAELESVIERRRRLGPDTYDEVWGGDHHLALAGTGRHARLQARLIQAIGPRVQDTSDEVTGPVNIGEPDDFRIPDAAVLPVGSDEKTWHASTALVAEILSPDDETYEEFGFYAAHGIEEVLVVDPARREVQVWVRRGDDYRQETASAFLGVTADDLAGARSRLTTRTWV